jgi:hypothetical protein
LINHRVVVSSRRWRMPACGPDRGSRCSSRCLLLVGAALNERLPRGIAHLAIRSAWCAPVPTSAMSRWPPQQAPGPSTSRASSVAARVSIELAGTMPARELGPLPDRPAASNSVTWSADSERRAEQHGDHQPLAHRHRQRARDPRPPARQQRAPRKSRRRPRRRARSC